MVAATACQWPLAVNMPMAPWTARSSSCADIWEYAGMWVDKEEEMWEGRA